MKKTKEFVRIWINLTLITFLINIPIILTGQNVIAAEEAQLGNPIYSTGIDLTSLKLQLFSAPKEFTNAAENNKLILDLPWHDGSFKSFLVVESPIMAPDFAKAYQDFKTYAVQGLEDKSVTGRIFISEFGLFGTFLTPSGTVGIRPQDLHNPFVHEIYSGRHTDDYDLTQFGCGFDEEIIPFLPPGKLDDIPNNAESSISNGATLKEYDLAVVTTGEFHDGNGGTVPAATAVVTSTVNAVQAMYDKDIAVRFMLLTPMVYTDPNTDPFDPTSGLSRTEMAANAVDDNFSQNTYDIGHCFHDSNEPPGGFSGGGVAQLSAVCDDSSFSSGYRKAGGWSGSSNNTTNGWHQLTAHEFGHMFSATHTFNGSGGSCTNCSGGNQSANTAYEIGSGTTIMSYQGICGPGQNIPASGALDNYFHAASLDQMVAFINNLSTGGSCPTTSMTGNTPPVANSNPCGATLTIPTGTPFWLDGTATDADDDVMSICWEQYDEDGAGVCPTHGFIGATAGASSIAPLFRSFPPNSSTTRTFPSMDDVVTGTNSDFDVLPTVGRTLTFRMTVRDNNASGGGMSCSEVAVTVDGSSGPFLVSDPNGGETFTAGGNITVDWDQANTSSFCTDVSILLSIDGGYTYPYTLATGILNTAETWTGTLPLGVPNVSTARVKVECGDYSCAAFFDISDADFTIMSDCLTESNYLCPAAACSFDQGDPGLDLDLDNFFGSGISSMAVDLDPSDPNMDVVTHDIGGTGCYNWGFQTDYEFVQFTVDATGDYTFTHNSGLFSINSVFLDATFDPNDPCPSFIGSNAENLGGGSATSFSSFTVTLTECTVYRLCAYTFGAAQTYTITMAGAGTISSSGAGPGGDYSYTFVAVDSSTDLIDAQDAGADFTALGAGSYNVYGAAYKSSGPTPPNNVDPTLWIGQTMSAILNSGECALFSFNNKPLTIIATSCSMTSAGLSNVGCDNNGTNCDDTDDIITFDLDPQGTGTGATYNVTVSSGTVTPTSGTYGVVTSFELQSGSAGAGNITVTVADVNDPACTASATITDPGSCSAGCSFPSIPSSCSSSLEPFTGFAGAGFTSNPVVGELCSGSWTPSGFSDSYTSCGDNTSGDYARGVADGNGETTGGIYGYDDSAGNQALWIQPTGADFTPGNLTYQIQNNTGATINDIDIAYDILVLNDQNRANDFNFSYSTDGTNFTNIAALDYQSELTAAGTPIVETVPRSTTISGITILDGDFIWLRWSGADAGGSGSRDEFGLDNITLCPTQCEILTSGLTNIQCNDNGTPSDVSDDYITFELDPTGANLGTSYTVSGATLSPSGGNYGSPTTFSTTAGTAGAGDLNLTITDDSDPGCTLNFTVTDPGNCSPNCEITASGLANIQCNDNGTTNDPTDDYITFDLDPSGFNLGGTYTVTGATLTPGSASYGSATTFQTDPGTAGAGDLSLTITDDGDGSCTFSETVTDPGTCSPDCNITASGLTNIQCNDNGTTSDPSDDYITFDLDPTGFNLGTSYSVGGASITPGGGNYGSVTSFQTDPGTAGAGDLNLTITDGTHGTCSFNFTVTDPGTCSPDCIILDAGLSNIQCNNNGTPSDDSDDYITFDLNPTGNNLGTTYTVLGTNLSPTGGNYGETTSFQTDPGTAGAGDLNLTVRDDSDHGCTLGFVVTDPGPCSTTCNLTGTGLANVQCNDNGTLTDPSDDYFTFDLDPTGVNLSTNGYSVTSSVTITPSTANYGSATSFQTPAGSAGGGNLIITVTDMDDAACTASSTLVDPTPNPNIAGTQDPATCGGLGSITIGGLTSGDSYQVYYDLGGTSDISTGPFTANGSGEITLNNLLEGTYTNIRVQDTATGCIGGSLTATLNDPMTPTYSVAGTDPSTCGGTDGSFLISGLTANTNFDVSYDDDGVGVGPLSLTSNSSGEIDIAGLDAGSYTNIIVTFATNCSGAPASVTLTDPTSPNPSISSSTDPTTCGGSDGTITIGGLTSGNSYTVNYDFNGSGTSQGPLTANASGEIVMSGLSAGNYSNISVTDNGTNCSGGSLSQTLSDPSAPTYSLGILTNPSSCGGNDGSIQLTGLNALTSYDVSYDFNGTGVGPLNLTSNGSGELLIPNLAAGNYTNIILSLAGCSGTPLSATLSDPNSPSLSETHVDVTCPGGSDGSIDLTVTGGTMPFTYDWDNDGTGDNDDSEDLSGLSQGTYNCTVTDNLGCTGTISVTINDGTDNTPPTAVCQDITVGLDSNGDAIISTAQIDNGSSDNCGTVNLSLDNDTFDCDDIGNQTVTLTVDDGNGNTNTCTATVTVEDNIAPVAVCQDITVNLDASGNAMIIPQDVDGGSSDNCVNVILSLNDDTFDCSSIGTQTITLTVEDGVGNSDMCTSNVEVEDNINPMAVCKDITVQLDNSGNATISATDIDNGSSDNCPFSLTIDVNTFNCGDIAAANIVILTATDASLNTNTCTASVTVEDNISPTVTCQNITVQLDNTGNVTITGTDVENLTLDNCVFYSLSLDNDSFDCTNIGGNTVTLTATDGSGNTGTCTATVTVEDNSNPTAVCQNITVSLDATGDAMIIPQDVDGGSNDNCGAFTLSIDDDAFDCNDIGPQPVVLTVDDGNGNTDQCTATVTVEDNMPPIALCQDITVVLDVVGAAVISPGSINNGSSDNCGGFTLALNQTLFDCFTLGGNTVTLTVTDDNSNSSTCTATVTVEDNQIPIAICQDVTVQLDANGNGSISTADVDNGSSDNCPPSLSLDIQNFGCADVGTNTVTLTVADGAGNSANCTSTITVEDNIPPVLICQNIGVSLDITGNVTITPQLVASAFGDNCGSVTLTLDINTFDCSNVGGNPVQVTGTDSNGNSNSCSATVTITDDSPPIAMCKDVTVQLDGLGTATITSADVENGSTDACGIASFSVSPNLFTCNELGANTVSLFVTDVNGNVGSCFATVTVKDDDNPCCDAPVAACQDFSIDLDLFGIGVITPSDIDGGSMADCGIASLTASQTTFTCAEVGTNTVTLTITDVFGNSDNCDATVFVGDVIPPVALCQDISVTLDNIGNAVVLPAQIDNGSNDECGIATLGLNQLAFSCMDVGLNPVILTVEDPSGNTSTCVATVGVIASTSCLPPDLTNEGGPSIDDPCTCRGNGAFDEEVVINSGSNQTWFVTSTTLLDPTTLTPFAPGTPFTEVPQGGGMSQYVLAGVHLSGVGYTMEAESPFWPNQNLTISNTCSYPDAEIEGLDIIICLETAPFTLEGNGGVGIEGTGSFTINGIPATIFDPAALGIGTHLVAFTFDAGDPASLLIPSDIGCSESIFQYITIVETPDNPVCNDLEHVALDPDCLAFITPDMILEGDVPCDDDFGVSIEDHQGNAVPNPVSGGWIGEVLTVNVTHLPTGNSCWGELIVEDKTKPTIFCVNPTIPCTVDINNAPRPASSDNCDNNPSENLIDLVLIDDDGCDDDIVRYKRTWIAIDDYGNESDPCMDTVSVQRPTSINFPGDRTWTCQQYNNNNNVVSPTNSGSGTINGLTGTWCLYEFTHSDVIVQGCGETFTIVRTWSVLDWCTGDITTDEQIIKIKDEEAPSISQNEFEVGTTVPGAHPQPCTSTGFLEAANITDNCHEFTVKIFTPLGEAIYVNGSDGTTGAYIPAPGLPVGVHTITYQATDECGNTSDYSVDITVVDDVAPVAICDEITEVTLSSDGLAEINADVLDDGSHDNCCMDRFEVGRMEDGCGYGTEFGPTVTLCCEDAATSPVILVFRAYDCDDNYNECMVQVNVDDKLKPVLVSCPGPQTITCDYYWDNLETELALGNESVLDQFGIPEYQDNCDLEVTPTHNVNIDECGIGTITRIWNAVDPSGNAANTCTQVINTLHVSDWVVEFPADVTVTCTDQVPQFEEPEIFNESCELVAVSFEDTHFNVVPDACFKIARRWAIINWCVVGDNIDDEVVEVPESQLGLIYPACDLDGDGDCDERTFRDSWNGTDFPSAADAGVNGAPDTDLDPDPWDGFIEYEQIIKVIDNVAPIFPDGCAVADVCIEETSCGTTVTFIEPVVQDCSIETNVTVESDLGSGYGPFDDVAPGIYTVTYTAMDQCGNSNSCQSTFEVLDCKKPTPYCKNGIIVELMVIDTPMVEVWAEDLNDGSFDNCPGEVVLSFSSDTTHQSIIFTCDDIGQQNVELWVTDASGNQDFCATVVFVQANMNQCPNIDDPLLAGTIANEANMGVKDVEVTINSANGFNDIMMTEDDGVFNFSALPLGDDYSITPMKDINPLNGVTTFDLVLITKHILGTQALSSPYKIIAADANRSRSVTTFDLVVLRKLILFIDDDFNNNTSWRFVPVDHEFPNPANPFEEMFPEVININNLGSDPLDPDFIGIKVGDVNGNANPISFKDSEDRNFGEALVFETSERVLRSGETYTIDFRSPGFDVQGYQFTLNFEKAALELVEIKESLASEENFGLTLLEEGAITSSWNGNIPEATESIFSLSFKAKIDCVLSDIMNINSRFTSAEAYSQDGELLEIQLEFTGEATESLFLLHQNRPNPFDRNTTIGFTLPESSNATLIVTDISGKVLWQINDDFFEGYNEVEIQPGEIKGSGLLYYQLETPTDIATKRMILINDQK